jgi:hypothetical protein
MDLHHGITNQRALGGFPGIDSRRQSNHRTWVCATHFFLFFHSGKTVRSSLFFLLGSGYQGFVSQHGPTTHHHLRCLKNEKLTTQLFRKKYSKSKIYVYNFFK